MDEIIEKLKKIQCFLMDMDGTIYWVINACQGLWNGYIP